jgi:hypothetical protein
MSGPLFESVGEKTVYAVRDWYVAKIQSQIESVCSAVVEQVNRALNESLPSDADFTVDDVKTTLGDSVVSDLRNQFCIPFGFDCNLNCTQKTEDGTPLWNETIRLAVDQLPNYLSPYEKILYDDEEFYALKVNNTCLFGPTGIPLLPPSPVTTWVITLNVWFIEVRGEYARFCIIDSSDETIFHPLFGHEGQSYVREKIPIFVNHTFVGENTRLPFGFSTVAFGVVPSWGMMVGDLSGGLIESDGWS